MDIFNSVFSLLHTFSNYIFFLGDNIFYFTLETYTLTVYPVNIAGVSKERKKSDEKIAAALARGESNRGPIEGKVA